MAETTSDLTPFHRRMAATCNNRTWELLEQEELTPAELDQMIHAAHAAFLHWDRVGTPVNRLRAWVTLAYAHLRGGSDALAEHYIEEAENLRKEGPKDMADWDESFLLDARSRLHALRGESPLAEEYRSKAQESGNNIAEEGDRAQFFLTFNRPLPQ